jgi:hypothetical protein
VLKNAILLAARLEGRDGKGKDELVGYLRHIAADYPTSFAPLLGRVLPLQIRALVVPNAGQANSLFGFRASKCLDAVSCVSSPSQAKPGRSPPVYLRMFSKPRSGNRGASGSTLLRHGPHYVSGGSFPMRWPVTSPETETRSTSHRETRFTGTATASTSDAGITIFE